MRATAVGTKLVGKLHEKIVHGKRISVLSDILASQLKPGLSVLDLGCGDGTLSLQIKHRVPNLRIQGVETLARPGCEIPCVQFDGATLPFPNKSFDVCMLVDVLHHTSDVRALLKEACRVSSRYILIKDHLDENRINHLLLKVMDWVGNWPHGVRNTYNYQSRAQWQRCFKELNLIPLTWITDLPPYPRSAGVLGWRQLHFISLLERGDGQL